MINPKSLYHNNKMQLNDSNKLNYHIDKIKNLIKSGVDMNSLSTLKYASFRGPIKIVNIAKEQMIKDFKFLPLSYDIIKHIVMEYI